MMLLLSLSTKSLVTGLMSDLRMFIGLSLLDKLEVDSHGPDQQPKYPSNIEPGLSDKGEVTSCLPSLALFLIIVGLSRVSVANPTPPTIMNAPPRAVVRMRVILDYTGFTPSSSWLRCLL